MKKKKKPSQIVKIIKHRDTFPIRVSIVNGGTFNGLLQPYINDKSSNSLSAFSLLTFSQTVLHLYLIR